MRYRYFHYSKYGLPLRKNNRRNHSQGKTVRVLTINAHMLMEKSCPLVHDSTFHRLWRKPSIVRKTCSGTSSISWICVKLVKVLTKIENECERSSPNFKRRVFLKEFTKNRSLSKSLKIATLVAQLRLCDFNKYTSAQYNIVQSSKLQTTYTCIEH